MSPVFNENQYMRPRSSLIRFEVEFLNKFKNYFEKKKFCKTFVDNFFYYYYRLDKLVLYNLFHYDLNHLRDKMNKLPFFFF